MVKGVFACLLKRKSGILPFSQRLSEGTIRFLGPLGFFNPRPLFCEEVIGRLPSFAFFGRF